MSKVLVNRDRFLADYGASRYLILDVLYYGMGGVREDFRLRVPAEKLLPPYFVAELGSEYVGGGASGERIWAARLVWDKRDTDAWMYLTATCPELRGRSLAGMHKGTVILDVKFSYCVAGVPDPFSDEGGGGVDDE